MVKSFDEHDWSAFSGAKRFPNGDDPLIDADDEQLLYVATADGFEVHESSLDNDNPGFWSLPMNLPNAAIARHIMQTLPGTTHELAELGFMRF